MMGSTLRPGRRAMAVLALVGCCSAVVIGLHGTVLAETAAAAAIVAAGPATVNATSAMEGAKGRRLDYSADAFSSWQNAISGNGEAFASMCFAMIGLMGGSSVNNVQQTFSQDQNNNLPSFQLSSWWQSFVQQAFQNAHSFLQSVPAYPDGSTFTDMMQDPVSDTLSTLRDLVFDVDTDSLDSGNLTAGGGIGAGFQVLDCHGNVIMSYGMGMGFGLTVGNGGAVGSAGVGGGGGVQLYNDGQLVYSLGGGGGGGQNMVSSGSWAASSDGFSNDPDNHTPGGSFTDAVEVVRQASCTPFSVTMGGGGGAGFDVFGGLQPMHFGAGMSFTGGVAPPGGDADPVSAVVTECNSKCVSGGADYNSCFCPCFQQGAQAAGLTWADSMKCTTT